MGSIEFDLCDVVIVGEVILLVKVVMGGIEIKVLCMWVVSVWVEYVLVGVDDCIVLLVVFVGWL